MWWVAGVHLRRLARDARLRIGGAMVLGLLAVTAGVGAAGTAIRAQAQARAAAVMRETWLAQGAKSPHDAAHFGVWAFAPVYQTAALDPGVDARSGAAAFLEPHRANAFRDRPAQDDGALQRATAWSAAAVLQIVVPLFLIALGYDSVAGERERGTAAQLRVAGVTPRVLAVGKALSLLAVAGVVLGVAALLGAAAVTATDATALPDYAARGAAALAAYGACYTTVVLATVVGSHVCARSRVALLALLGVWAVATWGVPAWADWAAERRHAVPTTPEALATLDADLAHAFDGFTPGARLDAFRASVLRRYGVDSAAALPVNLDALAMQAGELSTDSAYDRHADRLDAAYAARRDVRQWATAASPVVGVRLLSAALAGTDLGAHRAFERAAEAYRRDFVGLLNAYMAAHSRTGNWTSAADARLWASIPPLTPAAPAASVSLRPYATAAALLAAWPVAAAAALVLVTGGRRGPRR